jgi:hypothetical protein
MQFDQNFSSEMIAAIAYDRTRLALFVVFHKGPIVYAYEKVPPALVTSFLTAPSKGQFFLQHVKAQYPTRKLSDSEAHLLRTQLYANVVAPDGTWLVEMLQATPALSASVFF